MQINNKTWHIRQIKGTDEELCCGSIYALGKCDKNNRIIYISDRLHGNLLDKVILHEVCHAYMFENDVVIPLELEEQICTFVAFHSRDITEKADEILKGLERWRVDSYL